MWVGVASEKPCGWVWPLRSHVGGGGLWEAMWVGVASEKPCGWVWPLKCHVGGVASEKLCGWVWPLRSYVGGCGLWNAMWVGVASEKLCGWVWPLRSHVGGCGLWEAMWVGVALCWGVGVGDFATPCSPSSTLANCVPVTRNVNILSYGLFIPTRGWWVWSLRSWGGGGYDPLVVWKEGWGEELYNSLITC